jgi:hypothetical protein
MIDHRVDLPLTPLLERDDARHLVLNRVVERIATPIKEKGMGCLKGIGEWATENVGPG